ncbi:MAG: DUF3486 family protein [Pseudomonadota bacterium]
MAAESKRQGRGRLSSIELLPKEADEVVVWAAHELRERERTQLDIWQEFNARLADLGIASISKSAFNRHSVKMAEVARRVETTREITAVLTERLQPGQEDDLTIMVAELIKTLVFELLNSQGEAGFSPKQAMEMASAIKQAAAAQALSSTRRQKLEAELADRVEDAVDQVAQVKGMSKDTTDAIKRSILKKDAA